MVSGMPSPSLLTQCHLPRRERQCMSQAQHLLAVSRNRLSLWESWREAPERARMLTMSPPILCTEL